MQTGNWLEYEDEAQADLFNIIDYGIGQGFPDPERFVLQLQSRIERLRDFPQMGRIGRVPGTYEWVLHRTPFIAVYTLELPRILVWRVLHSARQWPPG